MELTFEQIAKEMGLSRSQVQGIYRSGMKKLKLNHPHTLQMLLKLASDLHQTPLAVED